MPPPRFVEPWNENRLIDSLRQAAQLMKPDDILTLAAVAYYRAQRGSVLRPGDEELGNALADLAVTGRIAYGKLQSAPVNDATLIAKTNTALIADGEAQPLPASVIGAVRLALDRAYGVAWALRGPVSQRVALRSELGWIAVSAEDDTPHRPVNVPTLPFEQHEISVTAASNLPGAPSVTLNTRFYIASAVEDTAPAPDPPDSRALPPDPTPHVPDGHEVILFLHGDCSSADEAAAIIPQLHMAGLAIGKKYSIISVDLPNNGYAQTFPHKDVAPSSDTSWPGGLGSHTPLQTPILDFTENFVVAFVNALDQITPIKNRFAGVIGGSLGGNLGLRLGRRVFTESAWLNAIVSWSAASVWAPMINDVLKSVAPGRCMAAADDPEKLSSRADHFNAVYDKKLDDALLPWTQPDTWYWKDWPFRATHILASRIGRREIYNTNFRQWHWRLSAEQLIFSHVDKVDREDSNSKFRYELNTVLQLLSAAQDDNYRGANIFDATRDLANRMVVTPGRSLFLANTGHSIHVERPQFLASKMVDFFTTAAMDPLFQVTCIHKQDGRIRRVGGTNLTTGESFNITEAECILSIGRGNEFFVMGADGSRASVYVVAGQSSIYLSTQRDSSVEDNLSSLPEC